MAENILNRFENIYDEEPEIDTSVKVKVGIIGTGWIAEEHARCYKAMPDVELVAAADLVPGKAEKFCKTNKLEGVRCYESGHAMLEAEDLDAVSICTYNCQHAPCAIDALEHGVHVMLEKPFTVTVDEAVEVMRAEKKSGKILTIGFQPRMSVNMKRIKQILESGELFEAHPDCDKLVVDLRMSPGGNAKFVSCFQEDYAKGLTAGQVYVLTGGYTGSASLSYIAVLKDTLGAVTVGEPTGQFTSFFHMQSSLDKPVVLPNSQISVMLSNSWRDGDPLVEVQYDENGKLYPWESMILPDVYVYQDIEDIRQGLDSVIEWVLAQ